MTLPGSFAVYWLSMVVGISSAMAYESPVAELPKDLSQLSLSQLEAYAIEIDTELNELAHFSLRSGVGSIGYRSNAYPNPEHTEWIQIHLDRTSFIDRIVIVPSIWRDSKSGFVADGFPDTFRIMAGAEGDAAGREIAFYGEKDQLLPHIAPLVIPCQTEASWIRLEATRLTPRHFDGKYNLELAEIMIFNGSDNIALKQRVTVSSTGTSEAGARKRAYVVDGFVPYLMDSGKGTQSIPFIGLSEPDEHPSLVLDLGAMYPINRIHLHSVDFNDTVPQTSPSGYAMPHKLVIEGANSEDFADAKTLITYERNSIYDTGPIIMRRFETRSCRYIRFTASEPYFFNEDQDNKSRMGFAEIEIFSNGHNVALGKLFKSKEMIYPQRFLETLTDGSNLFGRILSIRQWMEELARRHDLNEERPIVAEEIKNRYTRQKDLLQIFIVLTFLFGAGIAFIILIERIRRIRQATQTKERFAADLHDELGANLHTIGLLSDLSKEMIDQPKELAKLLDRVRTYTQRSSIAARHCTNMLEAKGICEDLVDEMKRCSRQLLSDLDYEITFSGEHIVKALTARKRIDIFLFFKESLINILRHSGATQVCIHLTAEPKKICLTIRDNGHGIDSEKDQVPASTRRRTRLLRGKVSAEHPEGGGTQITLTVKKRLFGFLL